jgi:hypothetical protein
MDYVVTLLALLALLPEFPMADVLSDLHYHFLSCYERLRLELTDSGFGLTDSRFFTSSLGTTSRVPT